MSYLISHILIAKSLCTRVLIHDIRIAKILLTNLLISEILLVEILRHDLPLFLSNSLISFFLSRGQNAIDFLFSSKAYTTCNEQKQYEYTKILTLTIKKIKKNTSAMALKTCVILVHRASVCVKQVIMWCVSIVSTKICYFNLI